MPDAIEISSDELHENFTDESNPPSENDNSLPIAASASVADSHSPSPHGTTVPPDTDNSRPAVAPEAVPAYPTTIAASSLRPHAETCETKRDDRETEEFIEWHRELRGVRAQEAVLFPTWFERQRSRLNQLEAAPTRRLTNLERLGLEQQLRVGSSVRVCELPMPADEFFLAFAMNTPVAHVLYDLDLRIVVQMVRRMDMQAEQHRDPFLLAERYGVASAPRFLFCAVKRFRRPARVWLASIALGEAPRWYTNIGSSKQQILLVHEVGDLEPRLTESEQLEYLLAWPMIGATED